jgi:hypothetical protein
MKYIKLFERFLNEMFKYGYDKNEQKGKTVIAYKSDIWVLDEKNFSKYSHAIINALGLQDEIHPDDLKINSFKWDDILVKNPQMLHGHIEGTTLNITNTTSGLRHTKHSPVVQKVLKTLGLTDIAIMQYDSKTGDFFTAYEFPDDERVKLKNVNFFHGTSLSHLFKILKLGITPRKFTNSESNYNRVQHIDKVFTTLNKEQAASHALNAASGNNSIPVIIVHSIPDVSKLDLDYDVAINYYKDTDRNDTLGYTKIANVSNHNDGDDIKVPNINTHLGKFSYLGRIPVSHIKSIIIDEETLYEYFHSREIGEEFDTEEEGSDNFNDWNHVAAHEFKKFYKELQDRVYFDIYGEEEEDEEEY